MPQSARPARKPVVTEPFRGLLREMREERDPRLPAVLHVANLNGWTLQSLGDAVGITREWVRRLIQSATPDESMDLPDVPMAPRAQVAAPKQSKPRLRIKPEIADRLREMRRVAATVNGGTPADAPERRVSEELSAALDSLVRQGVTVYEIARTLGVTQGAIAGRLARHGYRTATPSQEKHRYLGHPGETVNAAKMECLRGHPLSGDNLYVVQRTGARVCRQCDNLRQRAYRARKAQQG